MERQVRFLIGGLALWGLVGCGGEEDQKPQGRGGWGGGQGSWGGASAQEAALPVRAEAVKRGEISAYIQTHARLEAERWVQVIARTSGEVIDLRVEEGDRVKAGDLLALLDPEEAKLRRRQAQVAVEQAKSANQRTQALFERQLVSEEEFDATAHQLESAQVALSEAQLNLDYTQVRASISGTVMQRNVELGDLINANQPAFVVADLQPLLARIFVPEKRMGQISQGQEAEIAIDALPDQRFTGRVRMINPGVDPQSGTVKVTLEVPAGNGALRPGMFATVRLITQRRPNALIIPKKALVLETDEDDVFALDSNTVRRVPVKLGLVDGDRVEILSGLEEGRMVVTVGQESLKDGAAVRLAGQTAPPPAAAAAKSEAANGLPEGLEELLTEAQRKKLKELTANGEGGMRAIFSQLDLSDDQRQKVRALMRKQFGGRGGPGGRGGYGSGG